LIALWATAISIAPMARAQAPANFLGTVTAISGTTITVKTDAGQTYQVVVPADAAIKRIALGEKDLSKAEAIAFTGGRRSGVGEDRSRFSRGHFAGLACDRGQAV
jgi:hypothetical protein